MVRSGDEAPTDHPDSHHTLAAANLIKMLDSKFEEMSSNVVNAAKDAEEARKNARHASQVARKYLSKQQGGHGGKDEYFFDNDSQENEPVPDDNNSCTDRKTLEATIASRLAHRHHEDMLQLSLELERTRQALEREQMEHDETKTNAMHFKNLFKKSEAQMNKLMNDIETERQDTATEIDGLQQELKQVYQRLEMADEDAQLAVDLAQANSDKREEIEVLLFQALAQIENLQFDSGGNSNNTESVPTTRNSSIRKNPSPPSKVVRFDADRPPAQSLIFDAAPLPPAAPPVSASRALIQAGKTVFHKATSPDKSPSIQRRQKLREKLRRMHLDLNPATSPGLVHPHASPGAGDASVSRTITLLRDSARRLDLNPRLWDTDSDEEWQLEATARRYCSAVEAKLDRQTLNITELESLCALWEKGTVVTVTDKIYRA